MTVVSSWISVARSVWRPIRKPIAVTAPIVASPSMGKRWRGWSVPYGRKKTRSRAASYGTREPPSSPAKTDAKAVMRMSTVTTSAAPFPQVSSSTAEATDWEATEPGSVISCQSTTPRVPICSSR